MNKVLAVSIAFALLLCNGEFVQQASAAEAYQPKTQRGQLVHKIVKQWGPYVQEAYKANLNGWAKEMGPVFAKVPLNDLQKAADARNFDTMNDALLGASGVASGGAITPKALGDVSADLVFVPIPPCRILDTRLAGGAIAAGSTRGVDVSAVSDYTFQGGDASNCSGMGAAGSFAAVAVNFTSVTPAQTGYFTAFPFLGTQPLAATQVYTAGGILSNFAIVRLDQGASANEMSIFSERQLHLVADVVGYYTNPEATALQCVEVDGTPLNLAAGAAGNAFAGACAAGYTAVETQCRPSIFGMRVAGSWTSHCNMVNDSASAGTVTATARCCRVPGR
ncbi:MAG TPA: hypothetical protein VF471_10235 [Pseudoxanthomonas sp.]